MIALSRIELYASDGFPSRDDDIEYWTGPARAKAASIRGNTAVHRTDTLTPVQTFRLRILALSGPSNQMNHARINELEVH